MRIHPAPIHRPIHHPGALPAGPLSAAPAPADARAAAEARARRWDVAYVVLGLVTYTGAQFVLSAPDPEVDPTIGEVNPFNTLIQLVLLAGGALHVLHHPRTALRGLLHLAPFILLIGFCMLSTLWSQAPDRTFRRSLTFVAAILFVVRAADTLGPRAVMRLVIQVMMALCVASLMEVVLRPSVGFDVGDYADAVRGVFPQKNVLGAGLTATGLALSFLVLDRGRLDWKDGAVLAVLLVMLVLSRSTTALVMTAGIAAATVALLWMARGGGWLTGTLVLLVLGGLAAAGLVAAVGTAAVLDLLGKDDSLTGRVFIWEYVREAIARRPLLGHGFAAFWLPETPGAEMIWREMHWKVPTAHSGYLELRLEIGEIGLWLAFAAAAAVALRALHALGDDRRGRGLWALLLLAVYLFYNYTEAALLLPYLMMIFWLMSPLALARPGPAPAAPPRPVPPPIRGTARP